jgi:hypothetical protein
MEKIVTALSLTVEAGKEINMSKWGKVWHQSGSIQYKHCMEEGWHHHLEALADEPDPDDNHIHYKCKADSDGRGYSYVLCKVKVDGMSSTNRRRLIERINQTTELNLSYK